MKAQDYYKGLEVGDWLYDVEAAKGVEVVSVKLEDDLIFPSIQTKDLVSDKTTTVFIDADTPNKLRMTGHFSPTPGAPVLSVRITSKPKLVAYRWDPTNIRHQERLLTGNVFKMFTINGENREAEAALNRVKMALMVH